MKSLVFVFLMILNSYAEFRPRYRNDSCHRWKGHLKNANHHVKGNRPVFSEKAKKKLKKQLEEEFKDLNKASPTPIDLKHLMEKYMDLDLASLTAEADGLTASEILWKGILTLKALHFEEAYRFSTFRSDVASEKTHASLENYELTVDNYRALASSLQKDKISGDDALGELGFSDEEIAQLHNASVFARKLNDKCLEKTSRFCQKIVNGKTARHPALNALFAFRGALAHSRQGLAPSKKDQFENQLASFLAKDMLPTDALERQQRRSQEIQKLLVANKKCLNDPNLACPEEVVERLDALHKEFEKEYRSLKDTPQSSSNPLEQLHSKYQAKNMAQLLDNLHQTRRHLQAKSVEERSRESSELSYLKDLTAIKPFVENALEMELQQNQALSREIARQVCGRNITLTKLSTGGSLWDCQAKDPKAITKEKMEKIKFKMAKATAELKRLEKLGKASLSLKGPKQRLDNYEDMSDRVYTDVLERLKAFPVVRKCLENIPEKAKKQGAAAMFAKCRQDIGKEVLDEKIQGQLESLYKRKRIISAMLLNIAEQDEFEKKKNCRNQIARLVREMCKDGSVVVKRQKTCAKKPGLSEQFLSTDQVTVYNLTGDTTEILAQIEDPKSAALLQTNGQKVEDILEELASKKGACGGKFKSAKTGKEVELAPAIQRFAVSESNFMQKFYDGHPHFIDNGRQLVPTPPPPQTGFLPYLALYGIPRGFQVFNLYGGLQAQKQALEFPIRAYKAAGIISATESNFLTRACNNAQATQNQQALFECFRRGARVEGDQLTFNIRPTTSTLLFPPNFSLLGFGMQSFFTPPLSPGFP